MLKVCWISNIPSPYKVKLMNMISEDVELYVLFEQKSVSDRDKSWFLYDFNNYYVEYLDEMSKHPNYDQLFNFLNGYLNR